MAKENAQYAAINVAIAANVPLLIKGAPGMGKTTFQQVFHEVSNAYLETVIASLRDPTDFGGLPIKVAKQGETPGVVLAAPRWAQRLAAAVAEGKWAWVALFIDEITTAAPATQAALLRVIHERVVGDLALPKAVRMIAAANPPDQAAGGWDLAAPLANRFYHLDWSITAKDWADGFMQGFPAPDPLQLPESWEQTLIPKYKALIAGYINAKGREALLNVPKDEAKAGGPWPSPRTWEMAGRLLACREAAGIDKDSNVILLRGSVGDGEATSFSAWLKEQNLPNPRDLLKDADNFKLPERGDIVYTVLNSVVAEALSTGPNAKDWVAAWKVLAAAGEQGAYDVGAAAARNLAQHTRPDLPQAHQYVKPYIEMLKEAGLIKGGDTK